MEQNKIKNVFSDETRRRRHYSRRGEISDNLNFVFLILAGGQINVAGGEMIWPAANSMWPAARCFGRWRELFGRRRDEFTKICALGKIFAKIFAGGEMNMASGETLWPAAR